MRMPIDTPRPSAHPQRGRYVISCIAALITAVLAGGCYNPPTTGNPFVNRQRVRTERALDLAIVGDGFFIVRVSDNGGFLFTRRGALSVSSNGEIVNEDGYALQPKLIVGDATQITITPEGLVRASHGPDSANDVVGQIVLARFERPEAMVVDGHYRMPSDRSGDPITGVPGKKGLGLLAIGELEK